MYHTLVVFALFSLLCACQRETRQSAPRPQTVAGVFLHDISFTFKNGMPPDSILLLRWAAEIAATGGVIAFGLIGSPDSIGQLVRQQFLSSPVLPSDPTYTDRIAYQDSLKIVTRMNDSLAALFAGAATRLLHRQHRHHIWTDVNQGLKQANQFFSELDIADHRKILILNCDGQQDIILPSGQKEHTIHPEFISDGIAVITCGWTNTIHPDSWYRVESPLGLVSQIHSLICKHCST